MVVVTGAPKVGGNNGLVQYLQDTLGFGSNEANEGETVLAAARNQSTQRYVEEEDNSSLRAATLYGGARFVKYEPKPYTEEEDRLPPQPRAAFFHPNGRFEGAGRKKPQKQQQQQQQQQPSTFQQQQLQLYQQQEERYQQLQQEQLKEQHQRYQGLQRQQQQQQQQQPAVDLGPPRENATRRRIRKEWEKENPIQIVRATMHFDDSDSDSDDEMEPDYLRAHIWGRPGANRANFPLELDRKNGRTVNKGKYNGNMHRLVKAPPDKHYNPDFDIESSDEEEPYHKGYPASFQKAKVLVHPEPPKPYLETLPFYNLIRKKEEDD